MKSSITRSKIDNILDAGMLWRFTQRETAVGDTPQCFATVALPPSDLINSLISDNFNTPLYKSILHFVIFFATGETPESVKNPSYNKHRMGGVLGYTFRYLANSTLKRSIVLQTKTRIGKIQSDWSKQESVASWVNPPVGPPFNFFELECSDNTAASL